MNTEDKKTLSQAEIDAEIRKQFEALQRTPPGADHIIMKNIKDKVAVLLSLKETVTDKKERR